MEKRIGPANEPWSTWILKGQRKEEEHARETEKKDQ